LVAVAVTAARLVKAVSEVMVAMVVTAVSVVAS
jgi:hypothetical protein